MTDSLTEGVISMLTMSPFLRVEVARAQAEEVARAAEQARRRRADTHVDAPIDERSRRPVLVPRRLAGLMIRAHVARPLRERRLA